MLKLNPDLFTNIKSETDMVGDLGYPALFRHLTFKENKRELDKAKREIVYCRICSINKELFQPNVKSIYFDVELVFLAKDLITI
jgi:hypothetical protein